MQSFVYYLRNVYVRISIYEVGCQQIHARRDCTEAHELMEVSAYEIQILLYLQSTQQRPLMQFRYHVSSE